jgi:hypothetical protein
MQAINPKRSRLPFAFGHVMDCITLSYLAGCDIVDIAKRQHTTTGMRGLLLPNIKTKILRRRGGALPGALTVWPDE